jgi:hypothetical protein
MTMTAWKRITSEAAGGYATAVVLSTLYPTMFVLSQNWYALNLSQSLWLIAMAILAALVIYAVVELALWGTNALLAKWRGVSLPANVRPIVFAILCAALIGLLLQRTLKIALPDRTLLVPTYIAIGAAMIWAFVRGAQRHVSAFLALLSVIAGVSWAVSASDSSGSWLAEMKQDFEGTKFKHKPNIYLFIYDAYSNKDAYTKIFDFDNSAHYAALNQRGLKTLHTFSNYTSTLQTSIGTFLGAHHYYRTETGFADSQQARPFLAGIIHNPVLSTLKSNGYKVQYIHSLDYFVNELGTLDFMFPDKPISSSLRVFGVPLLKMKRRITLDDQKEILYERIHKPASGDEAPWFTFAHVNVPGHADFAYDWRYQSKFPERFRERTAIANVHMLETIDRIHAADPEAVIVIFGDHGGHRYNGLGNAADPNAAFKEAGVTPDIVALDESGILIAIGSAGRCDSYVYEGMTPVNMMRTVFACLSEDPGLLDNRADDITLYRQKTRNLLITARNGKALPAWEAFNPVAAPFR